MTSILLEGLGFMMSIIIWESIMKRIQADLWETEMENPAEGLYTHAYLWIREGGNVLFYNSGNREEIDAMAELGGVSYQFLSHQDELGPTLQYIASRYQAQLGGHVREQKEFSRFRNPDILFDQRQTYLERIEMIPTPGHSPGSICFLVDSPLGKRYLFTGDTLYFNARRELGVGFFPGYSDFDEYEASLQALRSLAPDVVISSATGGQGGYQEIDPASWPHRVDQALESLRSRYGKAVGG
ncbi:glyoxylase-like metal-dependent hydrolase (beta-lactamase superfamily II) [Natronospira proteinivora]|uniref:Glyoxylase-like metal-dependent hydrolase (Beta-lactamase superfamily II) n=1 Tax=Natronospira proteinivora TaxID=1807133 RepID=A0ABT1G5M4_9GAMM|nr:MBL fold metallo-hydrolase [Natronospira proteinivora]MCP1726604.1 glyoxylase-like metal-dependent hydrolase (beta-lactamase superfamily II) [Natronospira proteinivora]